MRPGRNIGATLLGALLTVGALAVPAFAYAHFAEPDVVLDRHGAPDPSISEEQLATLIGDAAERTGQQPPLILSYHDVQPDPEPDRKYTVTPQQLTDHLVMLRAAGYESITSQQLVDWLDGTGDLPDRPVMLTFDDGTSGLWSYADAVLEEQGFTGVVFVISTRVGDHRPYYLTAEEIDRLVESGRWEVHSHTRDGHERIPVDAEGTVHPFLISRAWLEEEGRVETRAEFEQRVADDLAGSIEDLDHWFTSDARLFAYPFSAEVEITDDPEATISSSELVAEAFDASMTNVLPDRLVSQRDRRQRILPRLEVFAATSTADLWTRISNAVPLPPTTSSPLADPDSWFDRTGEALAGVATGDVDQGSELADAAEFERPGSLTLTAPDDGYLPVFHLPGRSTDWVDYRVRTLMSGLGTRPGGPTGSLFALLGSEEQVQVSMSATFVRVGIGDVPTQQEIVAEQPLEADDSRTVAIEVTADTLVVLVDGVEIVRMALPGESTGGIGVAANRGPVRFSAMRLEAGERTSSAPNPTSGFEVTSGEWQGQGSVATTDSPVFRARSLDTDHGDVTVDLRFRIAEYTATSEDHEWDGVHLGLRYTSPNDLYYVSVARRDGGIAIKRKAGGVYETLATGELPLGVGEWHEASVTVTGGAGGTPVTILVSVDGQLVLSAIDQAAPLAEPGRISIRSDNVDVEFSDLQVRDA